MMTTWFAACLIQKGWQTLNSPDMLAEISLPKTTTCQTQNWALIAGRDSLKEQISIRPWNNCFQQINYFLAIKDNYRSSIPVSLLCLIWQPTFKAASQKASNNKHDWTPVKYLSVLPHNKTQKQLQH